MLRKNFFCLFFLIILFGINTESFCSCKKVVIQGLVGGAFLGGAAFFHSEEMSFYKKRRNQEKVKSQILISLHAGVPKEDCKNFYCDDFLGNGFLKKDKKQMILSASKRMLISENNISRYEGSEKGYCTLKNTFFVIGALLVTNSFCDFLSGHKR